MSRAEELLERARRSYVGWRFRDLERLYTSFGFEMRHGAKHAVFKHPEFPQLRATVPRGRSLAVTYVTDAVKRIDQLIALQGREVAKDGYP